MSGRARSAAVWTGSAMLAAVWLGPLPAMATSSITAHMVVHVSVVSIAAPLLALGVAGGRLDPLCQSARGARSALARTAPLLLAAVPASLFELVVVWSWHAPALHRAARESAGVFALEQASFLLAGMAVWLAAFGGPPEVRRSRAAAGIVGLLLTSMHMTLLGALIGLSTRPLYHGASHAVSAAASPADMPPAAESTLGGGLGAFGLGALGHGALADQQLGGALMLLGGGLPYLAGGLALARSLLRDGAVDDDADDDPDSRRSRPVISRREQTGAAR